MKSIDNSFITSTALQPFKKGTWSHLQSAYQEVFAAILSGNAAGLGTPSTTVYVIYGCLVTISGGNYTVSAGAVYYNGKVYLMDAKGSTAVPSGGNTYVCNIKTTYFTDATADPVTMTDGSTPNVHKIEKVEIESGASGSGIADYANFMGLPMATGAYSTLSSYAGSYTFDFRIDRKFYVSSAASAPQIDVNLTNAKVGCKQTVFVTINSGDTLVVNVSGSEQYIIAKPKNGAVYLHASGGNSSSITTTQIYRIELEYVGVMIGSKTVSVTIYGL
jgi:hypothetical protein